MQLGACHPAEARGLYAVRATRPALRPANGLLVLGEGLLRGSIGPFAVTCPLGQGASLPNGAPIRLASIDPQTPTIWGRDVRLSGRVTARPERYGLSLEIRIDGASLRRLTVELRPFEIEGDMRAAG